MSGTIFSIVCAIIGGLIVYLKMATNVRMLSLVAADHEAHAANYKSMGEDFENKWLDALEVNKKLVQQKSSQATKSGNYVETLSPLLEKFPADIFDPNTSLKWLGDPIDFIAFNFEVPEIV